MIGANSNTAPYNGATSQLATLALDNIKSFATGKTQTGGIGPTWVDSIAGGSSPSELAFSNDPASTYIDPASGAFGGELAQSNWCVSDYYDNVNESDPGVDHTLPATVSASSLSTTDKTYYYDGNLELDAGTIQALGQKIILKVHGNVYITGDLPGSGITYQPTTTLDNLPQFQLLVSGNINVSPNITNLDGFYDAQGVGGVGGVFSSCATATGPLDTVGTADACKTTLTVNGGVASQKMVLSRTKGDLSGNTAVFGQLEQPAETFVYSPQFWLPDTKVKKIGKWDSVTSLPPIL